MQRPDALPVVSRRTFLQGAAAVGTAAALGLSEVTSVPAPVAQANCEQAPAVHIQNNEPKTAMFTMVGQRIREITTPNGIIRNIEGYASGVDLRIYKAGYPDAAQVGTFKHDREILEENWATLYGMGPLDEKGYPVRNRKLDVYGSLFTFRGNWPLDGVGLVERCGISQEEEGWVFNVQRAVRVSEGNIRHTEEFQFVVVPGCGPKRQRYNSVIRESGPIVPTPEPTIVVPTPTPRTETVSPSQTPIREIGEPGESPAQIPLRSVGEPV